MPEDEGSRPTAESPDRGAATGGATGAAGAAALCWRRGLDSWKIPDGILLAAPESPFGFSLELFSRAARAALENPRPSPSRERALEALPGGGTVLDVGAGGGAASLPLVPPASFLVAVDESEAMLASFAEAASSRGTPYQLIAGRWPDVAASAPTADVVVCHHVAYNVPDLGPFFRALSGHARARVVVELTELHRLSNLSPLWLSIHGVERPSVPSARDAAAVAAELGYGVQVATSERSSWWEQTDRAEQVAFARKHLCVGPEHDAEIAAYLATPPAMQPRRLATLWWDL